MAKLITAHGGYKTLKSFQMSEIVFDLTFEFCGHYINSLKLREQIQGAARSGKQNISEGSQTSGTSKQSELRLVDVARASLEELKNDYKDFLRTHQLAEWDKNDKRALAIRQLANAPQRTYKSYLAYLSEPESAANCLLCIIHQTCFLLDQQLRALAGDLGQQGDLKDRYKTVRKNLAVNPPDDFQDFLKNKGLKTLDNGQVVPIEKEDK